MPRWCRRIRIRSWPSRISRASATIRCWPTATTPASRWPGCCAGAAPGRTPPPITWRSWARRSPRCRRPSGGGHGLIERLDALAARPGHQLIYSVGWELGERERAALRQVPEQAWQIAVDTRGEVRERRAEGACADRGCAHRRCWVEEACVTELTGLLRHGPGGDQLGGWPASMRIFARRERPHPGAQLSLFEAEDGWRYSLWVTNLPA